MNACRGLLCVSFLLLVTADEYKRCQNLFNLRRWQEAADCFTVAFEHEPTRATAASYNTAGCAFYELQKYDRAVVYYKAAVQLDDSVAMYHFNTALALAHVEDQFDAAQNYFDRAMTLDPGNSLFPYTLAVNYFNRRKYKVARKHFQRAADLDPLNPEIHNYLGVCSSELRDERNAIPAYQQAILLDSENSVYHFNLGVAFHNVRQYENAVFALRAAVDRDPNAKFLFQLAETYLTIHQYRNASLFYNQGLQMERTSFHLNQYAVATVEAYFTDKSRNDHKTLVFDEKSGKAQQYATQYFTDLHAFEDIKAAYLQAATAGKRAVYWWNLGNLAFQQRSYRDALHHYTNATKLEPDNAEYQHSIGSVYLELEEYDKAIPFLQKAVSLDGSKANYHFDLGLALSRERRFAEAKCAFEQAGLLEPLNANIQNWLATTLLDLGDWDQATQLFAKGVALDDFGQVHHIVMDGVFLSFGEERQANTSV